MRSHRLATLAALALLLPCRTLGAQTHIDLPPAPLPSADVVRTTLQATDVLYIGDDTYAPDPSLLIGKIFQIDIQAGQCGTDLPGSRVLFIGKISGYPIYPRSGSVLRGSYIVSRAVAASVSLLSFLQAGLNDSTLASVIVTDEDTQRANDGDAAYGAATHTWLAAHADLMANQNVCWLVLVDGVVHKTIVSRRFHMFHGTASAGAFGVNVGGSYYVSDDSYQLDHRFGLSVSILKRPDIFHPLRADDRTPTPRERAMLGQIQFIGAQASGTD